MLRHDRLSGTFCGHSRSFAGHRTGTSELIPLRSATSIHEDSHGEYLCAAGSEMAIYLTQSKS
eukprot:2984943-Amphidinium_carterae.1